MEKEIDLEYLKEVSQTIGSVAYEKGYTEILVLCNIKYKEAEEKSARRRPAWMN